jgi:hypothetical protein
VPEECDFRWNVSDALCVLKLLQCSARVDFLGSRRAIQQRASIRPILLLIATDKIGTFSNLAFNQASPIN